MISFDDVKKYLPQYLSTEANEGLFKELKQFPDNIDERIYTTILKDCENILQGDGIRDLLHINLPDTRVQRLPGMILSNSCGLDTKNDRLLPLRMVYAPIFNLEKYKNALIRAHVDTGNKHIGKIESHINEIRKQYVSHIFYLPKGGSLEDDSIVFFDRLNNCPSDIMTKDDLKKSRIFTLGDYGFYLFLFKLSIHFTRIREGIQRSPAN